MRKMYRFDRFFRGAILIRPIKLSSRGKFHQGTTPKDSARAMPSNASQASQKFHAGGFGGYVSYLTNIYHGFQWLVAEAVGFEPTKGFPPCSVSNRVLSASQPRLRRRSFNVAVRAGQEGKRPAPGALSQCGAALRTDHHRHRQHRAA